MASLVLGTIGSSIGANLGGALGGQLGWLAGSFLGSTLFKKDVHTKGPKLDDLKVTSSAYGASIPKVYGTYRIAGNIIWSSGLKETSHTQDVGGKGGSSQTHTTYTYSTSFAIALCEGPITGIRRIWANGNLIYNKGDTATSDELVVSVQVGITIYTGSETQEPDPLIEADKGIGNVPGYRGLAYIVFDTLQLEKYGNRIPNITCEVVEVGSTNSAPIKTFVPVEDIGRSWTSSSMYVTSTTSVLAIGDYTAYSIPMDVTAYIVNFDGTVTKGETISSSYTSPVPQGSSDEPCFMLQGYPGDDKKFKFYRVNISTGSIQTPIDIEINTTDTVGFSNLGSVHKHGNYIYMFMYDNGWNGVCQKVFKVSANTGGIATEIFDHPSSTLKAKIHDIGPSDNYIYGVLDNGTTLAKFDLNMNFIKYIEFTPSAPLSFSHYGGGETTVRCIDDSTVALYSSRWVHVIRNEVYIGSYLVYYGGYEQYGGWGISNNIFSMYRTDYGDMHYYDLSLLSADIVYASDIVSDLCQKSNIQSIDVSSITDTVKGYVRTGRMTAAAAIAPLLNAYNITAVESDYTLKFTPKSGVFLDTVLNSDLAATESETPLQDRLRVTRMKDIELPKRLTVAYTSEERNYDPGIQYSQRQVKDNG